MGHEADTDDADAVSEPIPEQVKVYARSEHRISRTQISENALKVLYRLQKEGFEAYLVGGCVRDLLLGREPKDFDVATDADPNQIKRIFRNCRIIGRRFRLAHVHFGREVIEVATFRADGNDDGMPLQNQEGRLLSDNVYGSIEDDVWRRDFTVNALYYRFKDFAVVDYVGGMDDLNAGVLKLIGEPTTRYREDPVRMLRAVRFAAKLGFIIDPSCQSAMVNNAALLNGIPSARLYDETLKLFMSGYALQTFEMLRHYGLFKMLFPLVEKHLVASGDHNDRVRLMITCALRNSDARISEGKTVTAYFLFAALLWEPLQQLAEEMVGQGVPTHLAYQEAANEAISRQVKTTALPRHITQAMREVWSLQPKFDYRLGTKPFRLLAQPRFRAAYDFLLLRAEVGVINKELTEWWEAFQHADEAQQKQMTLPSGSNKTNKRNKRKYNRRKAVRPSSPDRRGGD